jgi:hypothetical protein
LTYGIDTGLKDISLLTTSKRYFNSPEYIEFAVHLMSKSTESLTGAPPFASKVEQKDGTAVPLLYYSP